MTRPDLQVRFHNPGNPVDMGKLVDVITVGAPLRNKKVRDVVRVIAGTLLKTEEPAGVGIGLALVAVVEAFEHRYGKSKKRSE